MGTGICLCLDWKIGFGLLGLGMKDTKMAMGKLKYHYKDSCGWTFQSEIALKTATEQFLIENLY
jgi:hypothetical protein